MDKILPGHIFVPPTVHENVIFNVEKCEEDGLKFLVLVKDQKEMKMSLREWYDLAVKISEQK